MRLPEGLRRRERTVLLFLFTIAALPFVNRAYFIDDFYFTRIAQHLTRHPDQPYDFRTDDTDHDMPGWERGQPPRMVNPLFFHYYLAAVMRLAGDAAWVLRLSLIPFAWLAILSVYGLSRRFTGEPLYAAALFAATPAFFLTSYSLLIDAMMAAFFLTALWTFMEALDRRKAAWVILSGVLMGLTVWTKYSGILVYGLAFLWQALSPRDRRWWPGYGAVLIGVAMLLVWNAWTQSLYGEAHFWASAARAAKADETLVFFLYKGLVVASFLGGSAFFLVAAPVLVWRYSRSMALIVFLFCAGLAAIFLSPVGGFTRTQSAQLALWIGVMVSFGVLVLLRREVLQAPPGGVSDARPMRFLSLWLALGIAELIVIMPWTAARYGLTLLPPLIWILQRLWPGGGGWPKPALLTLTVCATTLLAFSDRAQANAARRLAQDVRDIDCRSRSCYYLGDTFSGYGPALDRLGWKAAFTNERLEPGDMIVVARHRLSAWWRLPAGYSYARVRTLRYPSRWPFRLMDVPASAGWYASAWGALPFVLSRNPLEHYDIVEVVRG